MPWDLGCDSGGEGQVVFPHWERHAPCKNMKVREGFPAEVIFELEPRAHQVKRQKCIPGRRHSVRRKRSLGVMVR